MVKYQNRIFIYITRMNSENCSRGVSGAAALSRWYYSVEVWYYKGNAIVFKNFLDLYYTNPGCTTTILL